jgi:hypothetical protein
MSFFCVIVVGWALRFWPDGSSVSIKHLMFSPRASATRAATRL